MSNRRKTGPTYFLTAFVRIYRLAVSTISGVKTVSPAREQGLHADILGQLVHSFWRESCVFLKRGQCTYSIHICTIFRRYVASFGGVSDDSPPDIVEDAYRDLYVWVYFHHPGSPVASEN